MTAPLSAEMLVAYWGTSDPPFGECGVTWTDADHDGRGWMTISGSEIIDDVMESSKLQRVRMNPMPVKDLESAEEMRAALPDHQHASRGYRGRGKSLGPTAFEPVPPSR